MHWITDLNFQFIDKSCCEKNLHRFATFNNNYDIQSHEKYWTQDFLKKIIFFILATSLKHQMNIVNMTSCV